MTNDNEQLTFLNTSDNNANKPVTVLGKTFKNDQERREYFTEELRKKLPELKQFEGFPKGEDEDILALSDPPYYTACPNPWLNDFLNEWDKKIDESYHVKPFTKDISEGKRDPVYNAHTYPTKVPHKAIMHYILHYTSPGDIILDGFAGTGMTGVAGNLCDNEEEIKKIGYRVDNDKNILNDQNQVFSKIGTRQILLNDLSPHGTFISYNFNTPVNNELFKREAERLLKHLEENNMWMFETFHVENERTTQEKGRVNYFVWTDVFTCPECTSELAFWEVAADKDTGKVNKEFSCPHCKVTLTKNRLERVFETVYDEFLSKSIAQAKQKMVRINYTYNNQKYYKSPDKSDLELVDKINNLKFSNWFPINPLPEGYNTRQPINSHGYTHVHHFYTKRILFILSELNNLITNSKFSAQLKLLFTSQLINISRLNRYRPEVSFPYNPLNGTLYIGSQVSEANPFDAYKNKLKNFIKAYKINSKSSVINCSSTSNMSLDENSVDYIFTDPPFGSNLNYSELSYLWEVWHKVTTNNKEEAIINSVQRKGLPEYQNLIEDCFRTYFKALKPGRWMTVEFSNSQASVWNAIQEAIQRVGFVIANVSTLDKKQGSFKAVTTTVAVKQDLIITAYKPISKLKNEINKKDEKDIALNFIVNHLEKLPVFFGEKGNAEIIVERTPRVLFDRMVAYHVQNGIDIPFSSGEFQSLLTQRFPERDGMIFLESQVAEYDKKRILIKDFIQTNLFVSDESSAIEWIRQKILNKPQTRQDLHADFMREIQHIAKHEVLPELDELLEQNFLQYEGNGSVPDRIVSYLKKTYKDVRELESDNPSMKNKAMNRWYVPDPNKQADLEKLREKSLLREFESYIEEISKNKKKLKQFRTEAIRTGFKKAWSDKEYQRIVDVGERLPEKVIQEDDKLLMYYDNAQIRLGI
ncbi:DNA methyltransferase [Oceanobacillus oncorhynchi]|uniref:DNA methyltransferase n=1 Tax=Oceanobacillus oncorhynchi TaxID=545501 RepID=UPI0025A44B95|nr:DNA methyltransferase [Oceanobacillus oncorhynchi]MDM8101338.1 DNA methyltransferase [Oceanobacillus oncorhynchi]